MKVKKIVTSKVAGVGTNPLIQRGFWGNLLTAQKEGMMKTMIPGAAAWFSAKAIVDIWTKDDSASQVGKVEKNFKKVFDTLVEVADYYANAATAIAFSSAIGGAICALIPPAAPAVPVLAAIATASGTIAAVGHAVALGLKVIRAIWNGIRMTKYEKGTADHAAAQAQFWSDIIGSIGNIIGIVSGGTFGLHTAPNFTSSVGGALGGELWNRGADLAGATGQTVGEETSKTSSKVSEKEVKELGKNLDKIEEAAQTQKTHSDQAIKTSEDDRGKMQELSDTSVEILDKAEEVKTKSEEVRDKTEDAEAKIKGNISKDFEKELTESDMEIIEQKIEEGENSEKELEKIQILVSQLDATVTPIVPELTVKIEEGKVSPESLPGVIDLGTPTVEAPEITPIIKQGTVQVEDDLTIEDLDPPQVQGKEEIIQQKFESQTIQTNSEKVSHRTNQPVIQRGFLRRMGAALLKRFGNIKKRVQAFINRIKRKIQKIFIKILGIEKPLKQQQTAIQEAKPLAIKTITEQGKAKTNASNALGKLDSLKSSISSN